MPSRICLLALGLLAVHGSVHAQSPAAAERVVTLAPNLAEMVFRVGAGDRLVGVVVHSDFPPAARRLPVVGDAFRIDFERLAGLAPDLVLAWGGGNPAHLVARLKEQGYRVEVLTPDSLEDIAEHMEMIGQWVGKAERARHAAGQFRDQLALLRADYAGASPVRVFYQISAQPLYTVNSAQFIGQIIELCGGVNIFAGLPELAPVVSPEAVVAADPDLILTGMNQVDSVRELWARWPIMRAVQSAQIHGLDDRLAARASPRLVDGARQFCQVMDRARSRQVPESGR